MPRSTRFFAFVVSLAVVGSAGVAHAQTTAVGSVSIKPEFTFTPRSVARLGDDLFVLTRPLTFNLGKESSPIIVPAGFLTDLASIPKALHWWQGKVDRSMAPAIVHDYLYWYGHCSKPEADAVMRLGMKGMETGSFTSAAIYSGVVNFGGQAYIENGNRRVGGEVRTFTAAYLEHVLNVPVSPAETLESARSKARAEGGLVASEIGHQDEKRVCALALQACQECVAQ